MKTLLTLILTITLPLTFTACGKGLRNSLNQNQSPSNDPITTLLPTPSPTPPVANFTNPVHALDVDMDGNITSSDSITIANYINAFGAAHNNWVPNSYKNKMMDVNKDGWVLRSDQLLVIRDINAKGSRALNGETQAPDPIIPDSVYAEVASQIKSRYLPSKISDSYELNKAGLDEKWLRAADQRYDPALEMSLIVLPDGKIYEWRDGATSKGSLVDILKPSYYANPTSLIAN